MELLITIAYVFLVRLIFFDYKLIRYTLFWKFVTFGIWIAAALTEIILLGQYAPYSKAMYVQSYVVQMAPEYGGMVQKVHAIPNKPMKRGDPLYQMDPTEFQLKVDVLQAQLAATDASVASLGLKVDAARAAVSRVQANLDLSRQKYAQYQAAAEKSAISRLQLEEVEKNIQAQKAELRSAEDALQEAKLAFDAEVDGTHAAVAEVVGKLEQAKYNLKHTTIRAPSDGYVANLQIYPGAFIRLKQPVMAYVNTEQQWLVATVLQRGIQNIRPGDKAQVALDMYPGKIFDAEVDSVVWAAGDSQGIPSGKLPNVGQMKGSELFTVKLRLKDNPPEYPFRFGASGLAAMYSSDAADFLVLLRQIELQSESFLNYLFNPFK